MHMQLQSKDQAQERPGRGRVDGLDNAKSGRAVEARADIARARAAECAALMPKARAIRARSSQSVRCYGQVVAEAVYTLRDPARRARISP